LVQKEATEDEAAVQRRRNQRRHVKAANRIGESKQESKQLRDLVTVVITTSPIPDHPSTAMLEHTVSSFGFVPDLLGCRIIICCDGTRRGDKVESDSLKRGLVTEGTEDRYRSFIDNMRGLIALHRAAGKGIFATAEVVELEHHHGFGHSLYRGLQLVNTRLCCVVQHDYSFVRRVDLKPVAEAMEERPKQIKYVGMHSTSTKDYRHKISSQYKIKLGGGGGGDDGRSGNVSVPLCPLLFWYDKTHLAEVSHYKSFFESGRVKLTQFVEDTLGQEMLAEIKEAGAKWEIPHSRYGTYLLVDSEEPAIRHSHGRRWREDRDVQRSSEIGVRREPEAERRHRAQERKDHNKARRRRKQTERRSMLESLTREERAAFLAAEKETPLG